MAIGWLTALKIIPWGDVIEHAPKVLNAARKLLLDRQQPTQVNPPSKDEVIAQLTATLAELAEQNARLVSAVELLRVRTRVMMWAIAVLALGLLALWLR